MVGPGVISTSPSGHTYRTQPRGKLLARVCPARWRQANCPCQIARGAECGYAGAMMPKR
jgi:hypothetical protein